MKFLSKRKDSAILVKGITYKMSGDNSRLRKMLLEEQCNYCAYTEKRINSLDSVDIEHFDSSKKGCDDYYNYYAVLTEANRKKIGKDAKHKNATFFLSLFFHDQTELNRRIYYEINDHIYEKTCPDDSEASAFIDFLGFNENALTKERRCFICALNELFNAAGYCENDIVNFFQNHPEQLSFVTAVEKFFHINLSNVINNSSK